MTEDTIIELYEQVERRRDERRDQAVAASGLAASLLTQEYEACWRAMRSLREAADWARLADRLAARRNEQAGDGTPVPTNQGGST